MSGDFGNDFIMLTDEDGNEVELEHLDTMDYNGETYMAFLPAEAADDELDDEAELIILKVEHVDGEDMLVTLDDENELQTTFELFLARFESEEDDEPDFSDDETEYEE